jgi:hypothetical protein
MKSSVFWDIMPCTCSPLRVTDISEEHVASIFRVEEQAEEPSVKAGDKQDGGDMFLRNVD